MSAVIANLSGPVQEVTSLDEPFWRCVPASLQETGIVVITDEPGLKYLHELQSFPLSRLASAIRSAARDDDWTTDDPPALLPPNNLRGPALTDDDEQAIAQALVYRLLDYLPQGELGNGDAVKSSRQRVNEPLEKRPARMPPPRRLPLSEHRIN